jgi:hypothetical protein
VARACACPNACSIILPMYLCELFNIKQFNYIIETPSFVKPMENKEVIAGGSIVMECMASGSPRPQLSWRKNSSPLQATERHFFTAENQLLIIVNTVPSDAGSYECEMSNSLGSVMGASLLTIKAGKTLLLYNNRGDIYYKLHGYLQSYLNYIGFTLIILL